MFAAIWRQIKRLCSNFSNDMGEAIDTGNVKRIIRDVFFALLAIAGAVGFIMSLTYIIMCNADFLLTWIGLPLLVLYVIVYLVSTSKSPQTVDKMLDPVDEELTRQRARENEDDVDTLMFGAIQEAASVTPLLRPHYIYDIQTSSPRGDRFYVVSRTAIFQVECALETSIDKVTEDIIQRELQRNVIKQCQRNPMLISSEAQGRAPVEVLDVKNLGNRVLIEVCLTTAASIPLIEARRRARVERQQRQQTVIDLDYPE